MVSLGLIIAIAAGVHSAGPLSCPVEGNTGMVDNVVENTYHFDVLNNDESQLIKEGVGCPKVLERTNTCITLNGWLISEIVILSLLCFNVLCHWSDITHWVYTTCLAHISRLTERKEKKLSDQREKMRE